MGRIVDLARAERPGLLIVDSVQTVASEELDGPPGSVGQVREATLRLMELAKSDGIPVVLVGPRDQGRDARRAEDARAPRGRRPLRRGRPDRRAPAAPRDQEPLRLHRGGRGVRDGRPRPRWRSSDPARAFLAEHDAPAPGSVVAPVLEGSRPLLVEVQALVAPTGAPSPRRTASGVDPNRLALLVAVLGRRAGIGLSGHDVYANLAGGLVGHRAGPGPAARAGAGVVAPGPAAARWHGRDRRGGPARRAARRGRPGSPPARGGAPRLHPRDRAAVEPRPALDAGHGGRRRRLPGRGDPGGARGARRNRPATTVSGRGSGPAIPRARLGPPAPAERVCAAGSDRGEA